MKKFSKKQLKSQIGDWIHTPLWKEFNKKYVRYLQKFVKKERKKYTIYPDKEDVFRAFRLTPPQDLKCVILGQNPFHDGSADGLAFSNGGDYQNISPSLQNIFKELENDLGFEDPVPDPDLSRWAKQGVLLLNTSLTVREGDADSHLKINGKELWQRFTKKALKICGAITKPVVFMLWGNHAKSFIEDVPPTVDPLKVKGFMDEDESGENRILQAYHPAAELYQNYDKVAFFGCNHFSKCNEFLKSKDIEPIEWQT